MSDGRFEAAQPDELWCGDITDIWAGEGWLYPAVFIGLYSRMAVGRSMSGRVTSRPVAGALEIGVARRGRPISQLVHSDRGSQYASSPFRTSSFLLRPSASERRAPTNFSTRETADCFAVMADYYTLAALVRQFNLSPAWGAKYSFGITFGAIYSPFAFD